MENQVSLFEIAKENKYILIDNCILFNSHNFNGKKTDLTIEEIIEDENNYSDELLNFIDYSKNMRITSKIYNEFICAMGSIRFRYGNLAFLKDSSIDLKKKIAKVQHNYCVIGKKLTSKVKKNLENRKSYLKYLNLITSIVKDSKFKDKISTNDIGLYAFACFLSKEEPSGIITRDYDFFKLYGLCRLDSNFTSKNGLNLCERIYMPDRFNVKLEHNYSLSEQIGTYL